MFLQNQAAVFDLPARWSGKIRSAASSTTPTCVTLAWLYCRDDAQRYSFSVGKLSSDEARRTSRPHQGANSSGAAKSISNVKRALQEGSG
jgi:hypothetical protein